jgi:DnaJ family protein C protein 13
MKVLSNVEACVLVGGCVLAVDLITVVHETSERTSIPLQSNLIAASAFMEPLKEWIYIDKDGSQVGPMEKDAIRRLWSKRDIDWTTRFWASGMLDWKKLRDIRELRWALASRVPVITPPQVDHVLPGRYIVIHINIISSVLVFYFLMFFSSPMFDDRS